MRIGNLRIAIGARRRGVNWSSYWTTSNLVVEGHSFMPTTKNLSGQIRDLLNVTSYYNSAVSGSSITDIESRAVTVDGKLVEETDNVANILALWIGINDISAGGSAADVFAALQSYVSDRVAAGWHLFVYTCTPSTGINQTTIDDFNTLVKTLASSKVDVIDVGLASELSDSTDTDYFSDGLHLTIAGEYAASQLLYDILVAKYSNAIIENNIEAEVELSLTSGGSGYNLLGIISNVDNYLIITGGGGCVLYSQPLDLKCNSIFIPAGVLKNIYYKNDGEVSEFKFKYSNISYIKFSPYGDGSVIGGSIAQFNNLEIFNDPTGSWSGSIAGLTSLTYIRCTGTNTLTGSVEALTSLAHLEIEGSNTISGSIEGLTLLEYLSAKGSNTLSGSFDALPLTYIHVAGTTNAIEGDLSNVSADLTGCIFNRGRLTTYTSGATWTNIAVFIYNQTGYQLSKEEVANMLIDMDNSIAGPIGKSIYIRGMELLADTTQGGAWGDFDGETSPSALAVAYKSLIKTKGCTLTYLGVTAPGVSGDGTGFPAGFGDWYRS